MKRYIQAGRARKGYGYGEKYRYWGNLKLADRVTENELSDEIKKDILDKAAQELHYKYRYGRMRDKSDLGLWDAYLSYFVMYLEDVLKYEEPDASWPTWYEDAKRRFDQWNQ